MAVRLTKGGNVRLDAEAPGVTAVRVELSWDVGAGKQGPAPVLDGLVSVLTEGESSGRVLLAHQVPHPGETLSARPAPPTPGAWESVTLVVTLTDVPPTVTRLLFGAVKYDAAHRGAGSGSGFESVAGAFVRVVDDADGRGIARYDVDRDTGSETVMVFGELYRHRGGWKFRAVGQGYAAGLPGLAGGDADARPDALALRPGEVAGYLRRESPARTRRTLADHLADHLAAGAPPAPAPPSPAPPAPAPPAPVPAARAKPPRSSDRKGRTGLRPPTSGPATPAPAPTPAPTPTPAPAPTPAARSRSALDLGGSDEPAPGDTPSAAPATRGTERVAVAVGENSSRHRQRVEHVDALDVGHPATTWTASDRGTGRMTLTLTWDALLTASGLPRPSDLHLAALWQADDRASGLMATLDGATTAPGELGPRQVLRLGRRSEREGQTVFVDLAALPSFRRVFVVVYGQHGAPEWEALRPVLRVAASTGEELAIRLAAAPSAARVCVLVSFHVDGEDLVIRREDAFAEGGLAEVAPRYGWDLEWNPDGMTPRVER